MFPITVVCARSREESPCSLRGRPAVYRPNNGLLQAKQRNRLVEPRRWKRSHVARLHRYITGQRGVGGKPHVEVGGIGMHVRGEHAADRVGGAPQAEARRVARVDVGGLHDEACLDVQRAAKQRPRQRGEEVGDEQLEGLVAEAHDARRIVAPRRRVLQDAQHAAPRRRQCLAVCLQRSVGPRAARRGMEALTDVVCV